MFSLKNKKIKLILAIVIVSISVYLSMVYLLPLFIPFLIAYIISRLINPIVNWLTKKLPIKKGIITIIILLIFIVIFGFIGRFICEKLFEQLRGFIQNWPRYSMIINEKMQTFCCDIESKMGLEKGYILSIVNENLYSFTQKGKNEIMPMLVDTSLPALLAIIEGFVVIVIVCISIYFITKDMDKIAKAKKNFIFSKELSLITAKLYNVGIAYLKAQIVIMFFTSIICFFGFKIIGNPYATLLGVIFGLLDALPLIGIGIVLIPWSIVYVISGSYVNAAILFITFLICYLVREFLEPRLIGKKAGIHPLISLVSIYIGYKLYGIIGVVLGPISYIIIAEITGEIYRAIYQGEDSNE